MKALLVIDMLNDFILEQGALYIGPAAGPLIPVIGEKIRSYREKGDRVIYVCDRHLPDDAEFAMFPAHCLENSSGGEVVAELAPLPGERIVYKRRFSAFFGTDLDLYLRENKIDALELAGVCTNICVLYTAADARMRAYPVAVSPSAVASFDEEAHRFALREMEKTLGVTLL
ncbi:MAG TPA: isochorismatase family cysteine hydrolase [Bacillota bacterium]|jgi:nicotinamidase-related amidase|nr:cysteine hydrolase [Bacillota bacterium]HOB86130.1 isochorismatase family cysteine hydrolase [Bacillota bacterium]HOP69857.1 isochorismatase family cysteine hydrolase [Bacillota bacterium]HPT34599.1 isochorismatase family cysteine hydrolase [Bacillota bacterium]HPZ64045.1 isochorismatase family cysteine hydrolase [Bacillota bacterium]